MNATQNNQELPAHLDWETYRIAPGCKDMATWAIKASYEKAVNAYLNPSTYTLPVAKQYRKCSVCRGNITFGGDTVCHDCAGE